MKILPVIFYLLKVILVISIGVFAIFFFGTVMSYLLDKHEERYIKIPVFSNNDLYFSRAG